MNANELADELENKPLAYGDDIQSWLCEASTMLRQQQAEIEALKNALHAIIVISDRNHEAWDKAKEILK